MLRKLLFAWGVVALVFAPVAAEAARVSPMIVEVKPAGRGSAARIELTNPGQTVFPVEVQMFRGVISEAGALEFGRAHVCTTVTNAHLVCRLLLEKKKT